MSKVLWVPKFRIFKIVQIFGEIVTNPAPHAPAHQLSRPPPEYVNAASSQLVLHRQNVDIMIQLYSNLSCKPNFCLPLFFSIPQFSLDSSDSVMGAQEKSHPAPLIPFALLQLTQVLLCPTSSFTAIRLL